LEFRDELSRKEYSISGLCQECQNRIFDSPDEDESSMPAPVRPPSPPEYVPTANDFVGEDYAMFSGQADAVERKYHKHIGKSGNTWLVADQEEAAENVYVTNNPKNTTSPKQRFEGFGGATLSFPLVDGTTFDLHGGWHSNADALYNDTGIDVRGTTRTFVVLGMDRTFIKGLRCVIKDVIYRDEKPTLGRYDRYKDLIKKFPQAKVYYMTSKGGGSNGQISDQDRKG
jgi:hypothetical protein